MCSGVAALPSPKNKGSSMKKFWLLLAVVLACFGALQLAKKKTATMQDAKVEKRISLFTWTNYIDRSVLEDFQRETGIEVVEENFSSNEILRSKLEAGAEGFDVIVPSDYM